MSIEIVLNLSSQLISKGVKQIASHIVRCYDLIQSQTEHVAPS